ncbi:TetR/AcrR family transcriptional regulator [Nocardiopsis changdeensis]|uniref:TetR/AcrR family transcriptional regulator C-terminal domain-containing protein n=1 Tax=Nocardiopsis changdeensis TaxID=2831969 RepID=A0ABX8BS61_9ACTN|nr:MULTISPECIES: TetR/AcrR family transcriptional regulator [Nocardiopsis]QUX25112.1 TetR/AcrR family transcriptional regulator C-terminal domain-containing protein [Nocardiopsis changdeensis]QYX35498.1 TetR/AcrR family transcriptional regulator [Nocardiopsis sp. MT53]
MTTRRSRTAPAGLTREGIVGVAIRVADADGPAAVSMRRIAQELGVDPMSLYRHIGAKDGLLDLMTDTVVAGIERVGPGATWVETAREQMLAARRTMLRHPWTAEVIKARPEPTPAALRYVDTVLGILRGGGLSLELTHHALHALGSRILGFSQDLFDDGAADTPPEVAAAQAAALAPEMPWVAEMITGSAHEGALGGCDDDAEFVFSLDLILEGLERRRAAGR